MGRILISSILIYIIFTGCSSVTVNNDYDIYTDFYKYKSFYVYTGILKDNKLETVPLVKKRVLDAITSEMKAKGFTKSDSIKADLTIFAMAHTAEKINVNNYGYSYGYGWGPYPYGRNIDVSYYTQGSLIIDFVDNEKDQLVWRGIGTTVLQNQGTPEEREQFINDAVAKILDQYPPAK